MLPKKTAARLLAQVVTRSRYDSATGTPPAVALKLALHDALLQKHRGLGILANEIAKQFTGKRPSIYRLSEFIHHNRGFALLCERGVPHIHQPESTTAEMSPAHGNPASWNLPAITTTGDLARWFNLRPEELAWFSDIRQLEDQSPQKLCHYTRRWRQKRDGTYRLIEAPKQRLKAVQRAILHTIVDKIPMHYAAHGFRAHRSILTLTAPHAAKAIVLKMDLRDFFPSFTFTRVHHFFLTAGYPDPVALLLAGLCTTTCPCSTLRELPREQRPRARDLYLRKHLPQGAPTSPALANLCAFNLDCRLAGLAKSAGAHYTRYADDMLFSGDENFARNAHRFAIHVMSIALEEGLEVNARKTRFMRQGVAQRAAGLILNSHPNIVRRDYDHLKAILTNCARHGPSSQNRAGHPNFRAHLEGRISHVLNVSAAKAAKLKSMIARIKWGDEFTGMCEADPSR